MNRWAILAALGLVLAAAMAASAAHSVMIHPDVNITVDIPKFGLVVPSNSGTWNFSLDSIDTNPDDGITFTASSTYSLRVFSNTNVVVSLNDGRIGVGSNYYTPAYGWELASGAGGTLNASSYTAQDPASAAVTLYTSGAPRNGAQINLTTFQVTVGDITTFTPGTATGTLVVTVAAAS